MLSLNTVVYCCIFCEDCTFTGPAPPRSPREGRFQKILRIVEDPKEVWSRGSQKVRHNCVTFTFTFRGGSLAVENFANEGHEVHLNVNWILC